MTKLMDRDDDNDRDAYKTKLIGPHGGGTRIVRPGGSEAREEVSQVVAWLVVVSGPGKGKSLELSYGMNIIGRGDKNGVQIDFGDVGISEDDHFRIAYDGENREFHLIPGRGRNLVYRQGKPLVDSQLLPETDEFRVGTTTLRFVPLCSKIWDWSMVEASPSAE